MLLNLVAKIKFYTILYIIIWILMAIFSMTIVDSCMIWFHFDCIMQLQKSYHIATNVCSRKSATTFGDLPDWYKTTVISIATQIPFTCSVQARDLLQGHRVTVTSGGSPTVMKPSVARLYLASQWNGIEGRSATFSGNKPSWDAISIYFQCSIRGISLHIITSSERYTVSNCRRIGCFFNRW